MGAIIEMLVAFLLRFRAAQIVKTAGERAVATVQGNPRLAFILGNLGGYALIDWIINWLEEIKLDIQEGVVERKNAVMQQLEEWEAQGLDFVQYAGEYYARKINQVTGAVEGDKLYLQTVLPDTLIAWVQEQIRQEIINGGGRLLSGQLVQQLRSGVLPVAGWAGRGQPGDVKWNDIQKRAADEALKLMTESERKRRLSNRERQARYRRNHRRITHWVKK